MIRWRHGLPGVLFWTIFCLSNGGRSFTKNMHRKSAFSLGISNSNLACAIIGLQRTRKAKKKKKSKFRLSSTLSLRIFCCVYVHFIKFARVLKLICRCFVHTGHERKVIAFVKYLSKTIRPIKENAIYLLLRSQSSRCAFIIFSVSPKRTSI